MAFLNRAMRAADRSEGVESRRNVGELRLRWHAFVNIPLTYHRAGGSQGDRWSWFGLAGFRVRWGPRWAVPIRRSGRGKGFTRRWVRERILAPAGWCIEMHPTGRHRATNRAAGEARRFRPIERATRAHRTGKPPASSTEGNSKERYRGRPPAPKLANHRTRTTFRSTDSSSFSAATVRRC